MEITSIETIPVEVPVRQLGEPYGIAPYVAGGRLDDIPEDVSFEEALSRNTAATTSGKKLLVRLDTDGGVTGWGEMKVPTMSFGRTAVEELIAPSVVGRQVWEIEAFVAEFSGFDSIYYTDITSLLGGVEMAMWDAYGKYLDQPVHRLIGGACVDSVPIAYCLGLLSPDESREHARFARDEGFQC